MAIILKNRDLTPEILTQHSGDEIDWIYNALDVCVTHEVYGKQKAELTPVTANTVEFSHSLAAPIFEMSLRGTLIDTARRSKLVAEFIEKKRILSRNVTVIVEEGVGFKPFNYRSPKQLLKLFYGVFQLSPIKGRNSNGKYTPTVKRDALEKLQEHYVARIICKHLIALRELDKKIDFLSTELDDDKRMRSSYNVAGTNTGRLSSSASIMNTGTNQQNVDKKLREIFIPDPGMKFCNVDLEQADSRNLGAILWELFVDELGPEEAGKYLDACESGDLHTRVCQMAYRDLPWEEDTPRNIADRIAYRELSYRDMSKKLGHGSNYYGKARTMATHLKVLTKMVELFQHNYFTQFPVIPKYHDWVRQQLAETGTIITPYFARQRVFWGRPDDDRTLREAIAYGPQSMTADQIDAGIINLWKYLKEVHLLIQVHDSILFQYPEEQEEVIIPRALELLKIVIPLKQGRLFHVPLEAKIGWNWADEDKDNPSGLIKWKGPKLDIRKRPALVTEPYTLEGMLDGKA